MSEYEPGRIYGGGGSNSGGNGGGIVSRPDDVPGRVRFEAISEGFRLMSDQMGPWVLAMLLCLGLMIAVCVVIGVGVAAAIVPSIMRNGDRFTPDLILPIAGAYIVALILFLVLGALIAAGMLNMAIRQIRGETLRVADLFSGTHAIGKLIGASLLIGLVRAAVEMIPMLPLQIFSGQSGSATFWSMFAISLPIELAIGGIIYALMLMTWPLIVDRDMAPDQAMRASFNVMKKNWPTALGVVAVLYLINTAASFFAGVGLLFTLPASFLTVAIIYRDLFPMREGWARMTPGSAETVDLPGMSPMPPSAASMTDRPAVKAPPVMAPPPQVDPMDR